MNLVFSVVVIAALAFRPSTAKQEILGRIFKGQDAENGQFKFMAVLVVEKIHCCRLIRDVNICGGSIISPNWVLTAAHCVDGIDRVTVYLGATVEEKATIAYKLPDGSFVIHENWDKSQTVNDVALIQIPKTLECYNVIYARLPLRYAHHPTDTFATKTALIMGWGRKSQGGQFADHLQKAKVQVMSTKECQEILPFVTDMDLCVNTSKTFGSICDGDSGGPLVLEESGEVIGVASFLSSDSCEKGYPAIFMRTTSYLPWIIDVIGEINL